MKTISKFMLTLLIGNVIAGPVDSSKITDVVVRRPELTFLGAVVAVSSTFGAYRAYQKLSEIAELQPQVEQYWRIAYGWEASLGRLSNRAQELEKQYGLTSGQDASAAYLPTEFARMRAYEAHAARYNAKIKDHPDLGELNEVINDQANAFYTFKNNNGGKVMRLRELQYGMGLPIYSPNPSDFK